MNFIKKNLILIIFGILCFLILIYIIFISKKNYIDFDGYIVLSNYLNVECKDGNCNNISSDTLNNKKIKYNLYTNDNSYNNVNLKFGSVWNIFNKDYQYISTPKDFIAYSGKFNLTPYNIEKYLQELNDDDIDYIYKKYKDNNFTISNKYIIDLNNDGIDDKIVFATNYSEYDLKSEKAFWICYAEINGKKNIIYEKVYKDNFNLVEDLSLKHLFKINDKIYFSILSEKFYNVNAKSLKLYVVSDNKVKKVV